MAAHEAATRKLTVKIKRYNPEIDDPPRWESYQVEADGMDRVLDVLQGVKWDHDESLGLRRSCAHGVCGSDAMRINGVNGLACKILVKNLPSDTLTVEPILGLPVIKDLIVDMKPFFDHYKSVLPFLINDDPRADDRAAPVARGAGPVTTTRPSASSAPAARRRARRSGATGSTSGPRRSSTPTASSSTRATGARPNGSRSSTTPRGSGDAGPSSTAPPPAPATSRSRRRSRRSSVPS